MNRSEFTDLLRARIADEGSMGIKTDAELVTYADQAVIIHSRKRIATGDEMVREWTGDTTGTVDLPSNFDSFCGTIPGVRLNDKVVFYDYVETPLYYNVSFPLISDFAILDEITIDRENLMCILTVACAVALNKNEYDIQQDMGIYQAMGSNPVPAVPSPAVAPTGGGESATEEY